MIICITQIATAAAATLVLFSTLLKMNQMTSETDNGIRFSYVLLCVAAFYAVLIILSADYFPTAIETLLFISYSTRQLSCRRERSRLHVRKSNHETTYN